MRKPTPTTRILFTEGGKGGDGKTEVAVSMVPWYHKRNIQPVMLDFDVENVTKSGFQNFYPEARKLDIHRHGAADELIDACETAESGVVIADLPAGSAEAFFPWFESLAGEAEAIGMIFTAIGVITDSADSVQSKLKWFAGLQDKVDYLIVCNEKEATHISFDYWTDDPKVREALEMFNPRAVTMEARVKEFQAELRNHETTLQAVIERKVEVPFLRKLKNVSRARRYQLHFFEQLDRVSEILLP